MDSLSSFLITFLSLFPSFFHSLSLSLSLSLSFSLSFSLSISFSAAEEIELGSESDDEEESSTLSNLSPEEIRQREKAQKDKGTAGKETEAGAEISALVNYVQPVHFHSFEHAESNRHSHS